MSVFAGERKRENTVFREFLLEAGRLKIFIKKNLKNHKKILKRVLTKSEIHDIMNIKRQATRVAC